MPGTSPTLTNDGPIPQAWTAVGQALQGNAALSSATALQTSQLVLDHNQNGIALVGQLGQLVTLGAGFLFPTATIATGSLTLTSLSSPTGITPGMAVTGAGIQAGATVTAVTATTLTLDQPCYVDASGVSLSIAGNGGVEIATGLSGQFGIAYLTTIAFTYGSITYASTAPWTMTVGDATGFTAGMQVAATWFNPDSNASEAILHPYMTVSSISGDVITLSDESNVPVGETYSMLYVVGATWTNLAIGAVPYA